MEPKFKVGDCLRWRGWPEGEGYPAERQMQLHTAESGMIEYFDGGLAWVSYVSDRRMDVFLSTGESARHFGVDDPCWEKVDGTEV